MNEQQARPPPLFATGDLVELQVGTYKVYQDSILMLRDGADVEDAHAWVMLAVGRVGVVMRSYDSSFQGQIAYTVQFGLDRVTSVYERELKAVI